MALNVRIQKHYQGFTLHTAFQCGKERLALLGASGSGKTLTLNCIAGVIKPDEGYIELDGHVLYDSQSKINLPPQKRRVGLLFQNYALFPNMTVEQNILCGLARVKDRREKHARLHNMLDRLRITGLAHRYPHQLSGGEQQRVALGRALAGEPRLLMLDEPFAALDEALKWQLEQELLEILEGLDTPVLYITHDMREVRHLCQRACVMDGGLSQPIDTTRAILQSPKTMAAARLSGCENVEDAELRTDGQIFVASWNALLSCAAPVPMDVRAVGVRACAIHIGGGENTIACKALRVVEDMDRRMLICRPEGTRATIRVELARDAKVPEPGEHVTLSIFPSDIGPLV